MQVYQSIIQHLKSKYPEGEAKAMARMILEDYFHISMLDVYMDKDIAFSEENKEELGKIFIRLDNYEPIQYVLGRVLFGGYTFKVTTDVLIPRPETEELVEWILQSWRSFGFILDIGTGSGCIPIVLSGKHPETKIRSCDISEETLNVARENNELNRTHVDFFHCDILNEVPAGKYDVIVSNPPYICPSEKQLMERNVLDWEPHRALFVPQEDPLLFYRRIASLGIDILRDNGCLFLEINPLYVDDIFCLLSALGYDDIEKKKDYAGKDRMVRAIKMKKNEGTK